MINSFLVLVSATCEGHGYKVKHMLQSHLTVREDSQVFNLAINFLKTK